MPGALSTDLYQLTMAAGYHVAADDTVASFELFVRDAKYSTEAERDGKGGWGVKVACASEKHGKYTWRRPGFEQTDEHPVMLVSWNDAAAFCQ